MNANIPTTLPFISTLNGFVLLKLHTISLNQRRQISVPELYTGVIIPKNRTKPSSSQIGFKQYWITGRSNYSANKEFLIPSNSVNFRDLRLGDQLKRDLIKEWINLHQ